MILPVALHREIVEFLTSLPSIDVHDGQRAFIKSAVLDSQLEGQITFSGSSVQFIELLVPQLVRYGRLEDGRYALEAVLESTKNFVGQDRREVCGRLLQEFRAFLSVKKPNPRLSKIILLVEDTESWRETITFILEDEGYKVICADGRKDAQKALQQHKIDAVVINLNLRSNSPVLDGLGYRVLEYIEQHQPELPRMVLSAIEKPGKVPELYEKYGVKHVDIKGDFSGPDFIQALDRVINEARNSSHPEQPVSNNQKQSGIQEEMITIIELLTQTTITTGIKFLFDQLGKLTTRLNEDQLKKIEEKKAEIEQSAAVVHSDQNVLTLQDSMKALIDVLPQDIDTDSITSFAGWVEERVDTDFDDLPGVGELLVKVLREKRKVEQNRMKKETLLTMESALKVEIEEFERTIAIGDAGPREKRKLYERISRALELLRADG